MASKETVTTVTEAWAEGEWGGPITLTDLENFIVDARAAGFTNQDRITVQAGTVLNTIRMRKVVTT